MREGMGYILLSVWGWLVAIGIIAVPVSVLAGLLKARFCSYGRAFVGTLLAAIAASILGYFFSSSYVDLPLCLASSLLIYAVVLDTSLPKAAVVLVLPGLVFFVAAFLITVAVGRHSFWVTWDGHRHLLYSP
jgi:hypothetical protein